MDQLAAMFPNWVGYLESPDTGNDNQKKHMLSIFIYNSHLSQRTVINFLPEVLYSSFFWFFICNVYRDEILVEIQKTSMRFTLSFACQRDSKS